jgi:hypothetical protein
VKAAGQLLTSQDWKGQEYTSIDELLGIDDKGEYKKNQIAHKKGDISPSSHKPYVKDQPGFMQGQEKGGKLTGKLVKESIDKPHPVEITQIPSFAIEQVRDGIPIPLANLWQYLNGENDGFTDIANSLGLGITKVGLPKEKTETTTTDVQPKTTTKDKASSNSKDERKENRGGGRHGKRTKISENEVQSDGDYK